MSPSSPSHLSQEARVSSTAKPIPESPKNHGLPREDLEVTERSESTIETYKNFNTFSMLSLAVSLMATWEALCSTMGSGLVSGGPVSLVYGFIAAFIGNLATAMSLSEPASMYPSAGGQYYFMAQLSRPSYKPLLSWYSGWLTLLGWLALTASAPFASGNLIQGLITLNYSSYTPERWHATLIYVGILGIALVLNLWGSWFLPFLENSIMVLHILFFFIIFIVVCVIPPSRNTAEFVFTYYQNNTGWDNDGVAWCLGLLTSAYIMIGYDSATHMSEEMNNPRVGVPRAMVGSLLINGTMGFALLIAVLFGMGDLKTALETPTGFPIIQIFATMTRGNVAATSAMTCSIIISASLATVGLLASTSRTLWAFARDGAPPFCHWLSRLDPNRHIPSNAVAATSIFLILLGLLNIASTTAFNAIISLTVVSLCLSYMLPIVAMLYRRLYTPEKLSYGPWRLPPKFGILSNIVALLYNCFISVFLLFPSYQPVTSKNMNYASVVLGSVMILVSIDWLVRGRRIFNGPV